MIEMIAFERARSLVLGSVHPLTTERVEVTSAGGRVLAEPAAVLVDLPSARIATRDGFALRAKEADPRRKLKVRGSAFAGSPYPEPLAPDAAVRVTTGAVIPEGADTVVPDEEVLREGEEIRVPGSLVVKSFIREQGEELQTGQPLFPAGTVIDPPILSLLVAAGHGEVKVTCQPRARVLAIGDELRPPGRPLLPGQTYPSVAWAIAAALRQLGMAEVRVELCADEEDAILECLPEPLAADLIVTLGGTGRGDRDVVISALENRGCGFEFRGIKMRPGHFTAFGLLREVPVLCLPGGPSAAEAGFYQFLRPVLLKMLGRHRLELPSIRAKLAESVSSPKGQYHLIRGRLERKEREEWFHPLHETGVHQELRLSNGYLAVAEAVEHLGAGSEVEIELIREPW